MRTSSILIPISKLTARDTAIAGGKGAHLGELTKAGVPVPDYFVITSGAFNVFLEESDLYQMIQAELSRIKYNDTNSIDRASNMIRDMIAKAEFPATIQTEIMSAFRRLKAPYVAVRSSATAEDSKTASWAGELETYLNTTSKTLISNVKKCWSSLFTPRALFYRHEKQLISSHISVAVIVQKMIQSDVSGICFTVHPVTKDKNQMIIEAGYGLGEAIVSGAITPDSYVLDKRTILFMDINVSSQEKMIVQNPRGGGVKWVKIKKSLQNKQKLPNIKIVQLAEWCKKIEKHYRHPCDIEWAYVKKKFFILQSRPITTL